ncbi:MAG: chromosome segregation protein SMC [Candidatus Dadabacteria bacterium]|nr:MAG: chromosome segregation protein SMC [Candidatus Dadabacteria bacterium]
MKRMHISRITLHGFKSFPDSTTLEFGRGISAIVGPNGCGKSNVLDALRWCFGTQSPRQLRGASMQDVIFAGGANRPPMGYAEVAVTFANEDGAAPEPWRDMPEIRLSRRIERSGDAQYRINNARVRRRDVQEFLMDIGYGEYSIVQQGQIGQLVQARPDEVRIFIEQASRMTKFRARREEAQNKLARTEENLERVLDLLQEVERQMNSLRRQADRTRKAKELDEQLRVVASVLLSRELETRRIEADALQQELVSLSDQIREVRIQIARVEAEQEELHAAQAAAEDGFQQLFSVQRAEQEARGELQNRLSALQNERTIREQEIAAANEDRADAEQRLAEAEQELGEIEPQLREHQQAIQQQQQGLAELEREVAEQRARVSELAARREAQRRQLLEAQQQQMRAETREREAELRINDIAERLQRFELETAEIAQQIEEESQHIGVREQELGAADSALKQVDSETASVGEQLQQAREQIRALRDQRQQLLRTLQDNRIEAERLAAVFDAREGQPDVIGQVDANFVVPWDRATPKSGFEDVVETALAGRFDALVLETPDAASALVEALRGSDEEARLSWVAKTAGGATDAQPPAGYIALADCIETADEDRAWVQALAAGVWLSESPLDPGAPLPDGAWQMIWDRTGVCVTHQGVWSAGTLKRKGMAHLAARRKELAALIAAEQSELESLEAEIATRQEALQALESRLQELVEKRSDAERTARDLVHQQQIADRHLAQLRSRQEALLQTREKLAREQAGAKELAEQARAAAADAAKQARTVERELDQVGVEMAPLESGLREREERLNGLRQSLDARREQVLILTRHVEATRQRITTQQQRAEQQARRIDAAQARMAVIAEECEQLQAQIDVHNERLAETAKQLEQQRHQQAELREQQIALEKKLRQQGQELEALQQQQHRKEQRLHDLRHAVSSAREQFTLRFGEPFDEVSQFDDTPTEQLIEERAQLEQKRERLGAINPAALEEFEEARERFEAITRQRDDLNESIEKLRQSIRKMNRESRDRFREAFETVNGHFGEIFTKLFRGGHAELQLVDPDDWLESGVQIVAQPPGTNLQRLELLSGGQSAMTAISLILAIFLTHPSPFCVLDEVDAPLDDANVGRFNQVLVEMNELAQILLITHNKQTMEIADTLHGVTMEQRGISKALPVRLA